MAPGISTPAYAVITPMRDEAPYVRKTLESMARQTLKPVLWVIVDDGSSDNSAKIVEEFSRSRPWIMLHRTKRENARQTGSAEVAAFQYGLPFLKDVLYEYIVKLDADLSFNGNYFSDLLGKFLANKRLGIASGVYLEQGKKGWAPVPMPSYHAAGASKVVRLECFNQMGGFVPFRGWDTVDEIKAMHKGWDTGHFDGLQFYHLKREGTGMGLLHTSIMHGEIFYRTCGGCFVFFLLKAMARMVRGKPFFLPGAYLLYGYLHAKALRMPLLVTGEEAAFYRNLLNRRLTSFLPAFSFLRPGMPLQRKWVG